MQCNNYQFTTSNICINQSYFLPIYYRVKAQYGINTVETFPKKDSVIIAKAKIKNKQINY